MKNALLLLALAPACLPACANGWHTHVEWRGWTILSNEYLYLGRKHTSYPLTYLVDGDPRTAWVFSGTAKGVEWDQSYPDNRPYRQWIEVEGNAVIDGVWIMNGYNRSPELFARNNRVTQIRILVDDKPIKTADLSDKMGWHKISLPRQPVHRLRLVFTGVRKGRDDDTCISEIALYDGKRKIDLHMPRLVLYSPGAEVGEDGEFYIISHSGKGTLRWSADSPYDWSPSHRRIAIADNEGRGGVLLSVVDVVAGRLVYQKTIPTRSQEYYAYPDGLAWKGERRLSVKIGSENASFTKMIRLSD